jgi:3-isopropylmalate/(R)-2-methylmalate dehydratase small subunit
MVDILKGRVWKFGNDINTDLMLPAIAEKQPEEDQPKYCFSANRPGWVELVEKGDMIVGGRNFGTGSSRPAARVLKALGITCLVAESINGLFLRNCVNFSLPALPCPGVFEAFEEGDVAEVDLRQGKITNLTSGAVIRTSPLPETLLKIISAGGIISMLEAEGYLEPV